MSLRYVSRATASIGPLVVVAISCAFLTVGSCSNSTSSNEPSDASPADQNPIGYEATFPSDSGADAPVTTGAIPDFTSGWNHVPWAPTCALYQPADGGFASVPLPDWIPCASGRAGCMEMTRGWSTRADATAPVIYERASSPSSTEVFIFREYSAYQYEYLVWDTSAGIEAAWRFNGTGTECVEVLGDISHGEVALTEAVYGGAKTVQQYLQVFGSAAQLMAKEVPDYAFQPMDIGFAPSLQMSNSSASSTVSALYFGEIDEMGVRDRLAMTVDPLDAGSGTRVSVNPYYTIVGDNVLFSSTSGLYAWSRSAGLSLLLPSSVSTYEHDIATDGTSLAWVESTNAGASGYASATLFTSPFTTTSAGLVPNKVMDISCSASLCESTMNQGYVTVGLDPIDPATHQFLIVRLSDGAYWKVSNGTTDVWDLGKVVNGELWISVLRGSYHTLERVTLESLGAPSTH